MKKSLPSIEKHFRYPTIAKDVANALFSSPDDAARRGSPQRNVLDAIVTPLVMLSSEEGYTQQAVAAMEPPSSSEPGSSNGQHKPTEVNQPGDEGRSAAGGAPTVVGVADTSSSTAFPPSLLGISEDPTPQDTPENGNTTENLATESNKVPNPDNKFKQAGARLMRGRGRSGNGVDELLSASRYGNFRRLVNVLTKNPGVDVDGVEDIMGCSALRLAVRNDHLEVVEKLLEVSSSSSIYESLMLSISLDRDNITETILRHPKYQQVRGRIHVGSLGKVIEQSDESSHDDTIFSADVTPLILAAQRNQFEIVTILLSFGDTIAKPHEFYCSCKDCRGATKFDELRFAKTRINMFRGLASEAYISLSSNDPILEAFQMGRKMRQLSRVERYFRAEYLALAGKLSDYAVVLLDKVRDGDELDKVLSATAGTTSQSNNDKLARLKLAIHYKEMKFVAHPSCQKKLTSMWVRNIPSLENMGSWRLLPWLLLLTLAYPFMCIMYWVYPWGKVARFLKTPVIKFWSNACSYIAFVLMVIAYSATERAADEHNRFISNHPVVGPLYLEYANVTGMRDWILRDSKIGYGTIVLSLWLVGLIWQGIKRLYTDRLLYFIENWYNAMDLVMFMLYMASFSLRYTTVFRIRESLDYFSLEENWQKLAHGDMAARDEKYWLNADRKYWDMLDPFLISEALFAVANLLSVCRLTYLLTLNERIGPLLISLARMILDVFAFMFIFVLIIVAFIVGFHNLYWYFYPHNRSQAELGSQSHSEVGEGSFGSVGLTIRTIYWSIFGMLELEKDFFDTFPKLKFTNMVGHVMFGFYNWIIVIIMINMLIAMMARSYDVISRDEDTEWKFSRSKLYMEYIKEGCTLCVPFNLVPTWSGVFLILRAIFQNCCSKTPRTDLTPNAPATTEHSPLPDVFSFSNGHRKDSKQDDAMETTASPSNTAQKRKGKPHLYDAVAFAVVMKNVIKRFIAQWHKGQRGTTTSMNAPDQTSDEGTLILMKRDISNFRHDIVSDISRQEKERERVRERLTNIENNMTSSTAELLAKTAVLTSNQDEQFARAEHSLDNLNETVNELKTSSSGQIDEISENLASLADQIRTIKAEHDAQFQGVLQAIHRLSLSCSSANRLPGDQLDPGFRGREIVSLVSSFDGSVVGSAVAEPVGATLVHRGPTYLDEHDATTWPRPVAVSAVKVTHDPSESPVW